MITRRTTQVVLSATPRSVTSGARCRAKRDRAAEGECSNCDYRLTGMHTGRIFLGSTLDSRSRPTQDPRSWDATTALMGDWAMHPAAVAFRKHCSALRGRIPFVAFRASHPAKPLSRAGFIQGLLKSRLNVWRKNWRFFPA